MRSFVARVWPLLVGFALVAAPIAGSAGQERLQVVAERTDLKWSSTGRRLGWLAEGAPVERLGGQGGWTRARVRGWADADHLVRSGDRYAIGRPETPLRASASGPVRGGLIQGVQVQRVGGGGKWYEIELIGWMPDGAVRPAAAAVAEAPSEPAVETPTPEPVAESAPGPEREVEPFAVARLSARAGLRGAPEGPVLADLPAGVVVRALESRGGWTRVEVEGWVPASAVQVGVEGDVDPEVVELAPSGTFVGRSVTWTVEYVAVQTADEWRTDFRRGETFALARVPGGEGRYVYLALPERLAPRFRELAPFERIRVAGTIRTERSELTGNPILDVTRIGP